MISIRMRCVWFRFWNVKYFLIFDRSLPFFLYTLLAATSQNVIFGAEFGLRNPSIATHTTINHPFQNPVMQMSKTAMRMQQQNSTSQPRRERQSSKEETGDIFGAAGKMDAEGFIRTGITTASGKDKVLERVQAARTV